MWLVRYCRSASPETATEGVSECSFSVPAHGDAFDFDVTVCLSWSADGLRRRRGPDAAERDHVEGLVRTETRAIARRHSPYDAESAEREVNAGLGALLGGLSARDGRVLLRWAARAEVRPGEDLRAMERDRARRLYEIEGKAAEARHRAKTAEETRLAWEAFLAGARESRHARYAMRLAEQPQHTAGIIAEMLDEDEETAASFIAKLDKLVSSHRQGEIYELVVGSDSALRHAMIALGLPVPPLDPDPLLPSGSAQR